MANMIHEEFVFDNLHGQHRFDDRKAMSQNSLAKPLAGDKRTTHDGKAPFATLKNA